MLCMLYIPLQLQGGFRSIDIQNSPLWMTYYFPDFSCCLSRSPWEKEDNTIYDCVTANLTFQEVILSVVSFCLHRLQGHECARGMAPHFTTTLPFRHLLDSQPGVLFKSLSRFIVAVSDKKAVWLASRCIIMTAGLAVYGIAVIVSLQWHTEGERKRESEGDNWDALTAKMKRALKQRDAWNASEKQ